VPRRESKRSLDLPPYNLKNPGLDLDLFGLEDHHTAVAPCHDRIAKRLVASERFPNCLSGRSHQHIGVEAGSGNGCRLGFS